MLNILITLKRVSTMFRYFSTEKQDIKLINKNVWYSTTYDIKQCAFPQM